MKQAHKQRLVGGIVLFALGLIFIPVVLDFSQDTRSSIMDGEIPKGPDEMKMEVLPLDIWSKKIDPEIDTMDKVIETPSRVPPPPVKTTPKSIAESAPASVAAEDESQEPASDKELVAESKSVPQIPQGTIAWVVQIASFNDEPKALALRDELRKSGYTTFVERGASGKDVLYRVKVGPVLARSEATKMKANIQKQTRLEGLVMSYR